MAPGVGIERIVTIAATTAMPGLRFNSSLRSWRELSSGAVGELAAGSPGPRRRSTTLEAPTSTVLRRVAGSRRGGGLGAGRLLERELIGLGRCGPRPRL